MREIPIENKITRQTIDKKTGITIEEQLLDYCKEPRTINEIRERFNITTNYRVNKSFTKPLIDQGKLQYTIPEDVDNLHQMYLTVGIERTPEIEEIIKQKSITKESAEYKQKILNAIKGDKYDRFHRKDHPPPPKGARPYPRGVGRAA